MDLRPIKRYVSALNITDSAKPSLFIIDVPVSNPRVSSRVLEKSPEKPYNAHNSYN